MSAFDTVVKRVQPQVSLERLTPSNLTSGAYSSNGIYAWTLQAGKLGSINGSTYGTYGLIGIEMARNRWSNLWIGISCGAWWNQATTLSVYGIGTSGITVTPLNIIDQRCKLLSVTIASGATNMRFSISDALAADGGVIGGSTVVADATYRIQPGLACPQIAIEFVTGSAPSSGAIDFIDICRTT